ncbi:Gfo/Idh/MocA family protein [Gulosibacter molinativorax]|uniref:Gfo/Idh/MocA family oxidoreductase n=1 Tax=Gulosibacter molinativorax TaxID=256821 RepID=A0ABT7C6Z9_9MICO|nr:Gfo/Idh/MocA family oxidoreductase [Gulosibacter molinativorax]MDJ1370940.1 gfo/Idh/MocA family oxidoreductase [Gulosibacter molinativorax]QUY62730.1 Inositol 2-dehydrogenase [Gulosibacter molinativorax]
MTIRTGLIGLGMMGRHHARVMRSIEGMELVAVADAFGDSHGVAGDLPLFASVDELIDYGVDAVMCAVPTGLHEEVGLKLAEAGVHAMVEKPIAENVAAGERLAEAFASRDLIGAVGHIERFNPALLELRRRIDAGQLGQVYQVATRREGPFPSRIADVGVVKDLATHDIDLTAWLNRSKYEQISANVVKITGRAYEDMVVAVGQLSNGVIVNHTVNWLSASKTRQTVVTGENGVFVADTLTADLTFFENGTVRSTWQPVENFRGVTEGDVVRYAFEKQEPLKTEHEAWRDAILGQPSEYVSMAEGLETLKVAELMIESARTGETKRA